MSWEILTTDTVLSEFTPAEASAIRNLQAGSGASGSGPPYLNIDMIVIHVVDEVRDYIRAGDYPLDEIDDRTIPTGLFADAIAIARWRILIAVPLLKQLQTEDRKQAFLDALKKLQLIADQKFVPENPNPVATVARGGNWNAENKLIMRTHPIPRPGSQFTPQTNTYANPDAPQDTEQS